MDIRMKHDVAIETMKAAPPVVVSAAGLNVTLNTVVLVLTGIYIVLQVAHLLWKWHKQSKERDYE